MWSGTTSPGSSTRPSGNSPRATSSALLMPRHHDGLEPGLAGIVGLVVEVGERHYHAMKVDEVEIQWISVRMRVDQRPGDLARLRPGEPHAASFNRCV